MLHRSHLCGYDLNITYPQNGHFPTLNPFFPDFTEERHARRFAKHKFVKNALRKGRFHAHRELSERGLDDQTYAQLERRDAWKRDLSGRPNGTIDPFYGCDIYDEMIDYALNFSAPWSEFLHDRLQVPDAC